MKDAVLKSKPERRAWEEAPSFFKWTCGNYPAVLRARSLDSFADKLAAAKDLRLEGNNAYLDNMLEEAMLKCELHSIWQSCSARVAYVL
jgi:hypothetical protein